MKECYPAFSCLCFWTVTLYLFFAGNMTAQTLRFNELSGDSGNNDGTNDGIVELINTDGAPFDASCYVISNGEWIVVLPPNTIIPAGDVFLIACSEGQNSGVNPNPIPGSGLTCATCDFPSMPIDFDVCDPVNAAYVDWAATGFTIDNQADDDGDQLVLFAPDGTIVQAVKWGGGATSAFDNTAVQTGTYTLGAPGTGGGGLSSAELPLALQAGGSCATGATYVMPIVTDAVYEDLTGAPNPDGKALNNSILQGCNSSFIYNSGTNNWSKTDHPNPGQPNDSNAYNFTFSAPTVQCTGAEQPVTVTLEVYNWQAVTPGVVNAKGGVGSFVSFDGGATVIPWDTYDRNDASGVTTTTYTFTPSGNQTLSLVWDDDKSSLFASTPTGSSSATAVVNNTTPSDCYTIEQHQVIVAPIMTASAMSISCPMDFPMGIVNIGSLITGGYNVTYELFDNGTSQGSNSTGIFNIPNNFTGPITAVVTDGSGCTNPITISIDNSCRQAPVCPAHLDYDACTTSSGNFCSGDDIHLSIDATTATGLPDGGRIEWVQVADPSDDPYLSGTVVATQNISMNPATASVYISSYTPNPAGTDCASGSEETIVLTNPGAAAVDIGGFVIIGNSDGLPMYTVPSGTIIAPGGTYSFNSCPVPGNSSQTFLANSTFPRTIQLEVNGSIVQTIAYNAAASGTAYPVTDPNLSYNTSATVATLTPACATYMIPNDACNSTIHIRPRIVPVDVMCNNPTLPALSYDIICPIITLSGDVIICAPALGTATITASNTNGGNVSITLVRLSDASSYGPFTRMGDGIIIATDLPAGEFQIQMASVTDACMPSISGTATVQINPASDITISGMMNVCPGLIAEIPFTINTGTLPFRITYNIDGGTNQIVEVFTNQLNLPTTGLAPGAHTVNIVAINDDNNCPGTFSGAFSVDVLTPPDLAAIPAQSNICPATSVDLTSISVIDNNNTTGTFSYHTTLAGAWTNNITDLVANPNDVMMGTYYIRKQTAQGCFDVVSVDVTITPCVCTNPPSVAITETNVSTCGTSVATFNYTVENGPAMLSADGTGILSTNTLPNGTGTFTYTPAAEDVGNTVTITAVIADPDGMGPCTEQSDKVVITFITLNPGSISGNQTICFSKDPTPFTATAATANADAIITYQWERSFTDCNTDFTTVSNTEVYDIAKGALQQTAYFRRRAIAVLNGVQCESLSNCVTITVLPINCGAFPWNGN